MSNLLQVVRYQLKVLNKKGAAPLMMEFDVSEETAPYLVSSTRALMWIDEAHPGSKIKAAVRDCKAPGELFMAVLREVSQKGREMEWGNVHPFSREGMDAAIEHVDYYEMGELELLAPRSLGKDGKPVAPEWLRVKEAGIPIRYTSWLDEGWAVVVPRIREFVGVLGHLGNDKVVLSVHNASRSMGILTAGH